MCSGRYRGVRVGEGEEDTRRGGELVRSDWAGATGFSRGGVRPSVCGPRVLTGCASLRFFVEDVVNVSCHCSSEGR